MLQCYVQFLRPSTFLSVFFNCYFLTFFYTHLMQDIFKVDKTRALPIERQMSVVYSIRNPRFSGWKEQEEGSKLETKRAATVQARGGNRHAKVQPSAGLSNSNKFYKH